MIKSSHALQTYVSKALPLIGLKDIHGGYQEEVRDTPKDIALLGFYRIASSFIKEIEELNPDLLQQLLVVDYNPVVYQKLHNLGVKVVYGDIGHLETLHHAGLEDAKLVLSTIPDDILVGTDNLKIIKLVKHLCPEAKIILTAESSAAALKMYQEGADYVLLPNMLAGSHLVPIVEDLLRHGATSLKEETIQDLKGRGEILA
jgi:Trk K+ transport system NAD-binding subunit